MEETPEATQNTSNGEQSGKQTTRLRLPDLPDLKLGTEGDLNGFDATDSEFLHFVQSLVPLTGEQTDHWTWEERRDFLNWCLDEQVLEVSDGRLILLEETIPTAPLSVQSEAESTAPTVRPGSEEDAGFLHDVERARPVIEAKPDIDAPGLAEALGLESAIYAQTIKVYVNAQKSAVEETH
jgi:hypothetical protein